MQPSIYETYDDRYPANLQEQEKDLYKIPQLCERMAKDACHRGMRTVYEEIGGEDKGIINNIRLSNENTNRWNDESIRQALAAWILTRTIPGVTTRYFLGIRLNMTTATNLHTTSNIQRWEDTCISYRSPHTQ